MQYYSNKEYELKEQKGTPPFIFCPKRKHKVFDSVRISLKTSIKTTKM